MDSYCVRDRRKTPSVDEKLTIAANGRKMIRSKCAVCGGNKTTFVK